MSAERRIAERRRTVRDFRSEELVMKGFVPSKSKANLSFWRKLNKICWSGVVSMFLEMDNIDNVPLSGEQEEDLKAGLKELCW